MSDKKLPSGQRLMINMYGKSHLLNIVEYVCCVDQ